MSRMEPLDQRARHRGMKITMKRFAIAIAGLALAAGLTACDEQDTPQSQETASTSVEENQADDGKDTPSLDPSSGIDDEKGTEGMTLTGTVSSGVEMGCVLLEFEGTTYNLVGGDASVLSPGTEVEVTGTVNEGLMTTCQQGVPFEVQSAAAK
ncbi:MAG TPA: hypothetical protein H9881_14335 [Candidatus Stackebrandtia excrementipullorum]|nr:hypothetical protein [Candidatus Stackebrandtia excrementipullorum]